MKAILFLVTMVLALLPYPDNNFNIYACLLSSQTGSKDIKVQIKNDLRTPYQIKKVVIDAGHGGRDAGCSGHHSKEKHIALNIALKLGRMMKTHYPDVDIIYTRTKDVFVPLHKRAAIANTHKADLFISIHCNALPGHNGVKGSETYVLGLHRAEENLAVAKRENASILMEDNYSKQYHGYDPHSTEGHIILSMFQNAFLEQSILFAEKVEQNIQRYAHGNSKGVKQAGFLVLRETTMPSVLIESGYLTNRSDNDYLLTDQGQTAIANAILQAFGSYKYEIEYTESNPVLAQHKTIRQVQSSGSHQQTKSAGTFSKSNVPPRIFESPASTRSSKIISSSPPVKQQMVKSATPIEYKILLATSEKLIDTKKAPWSNIEYAVQVKKEQGVFKYYVIGFKDYNTASKVKKQMRKAGFKEAFVVAFQEGKRVKVVQ